jgi:hypothetical protein
MKKIVLTFGCLSGVVSAVMMFITMVFVEQIGFDKGVIVGYTAITLSLLFVYFGVRSYRDNQLGGSITFGRAFAAGLLITLISGLFYVAAWEFGSRRFFPDFADKYGAYVIEQARSTGASEAELDAKAAEVAEMKRMMADPIMEPAMIFMEPLPVGILVTLVSAGVLRRKK